VVFSTGGIGATPDDHTRQCAARAQGVELALHLEAKALIEQRMRNLAQEQGRVYDAAQADNLHRLNMGVFPAGATIIPNPFNKIPGFFCASPAASNSCSDGQSPGIQPRGIYFVPGFPVMAHPMMAWVLDAFYSDLFVRGAWMEQSVIVFGAMEATLTPLMEQIESQHAVKVFSLPSVDHPEYGKHIELGVKGSPETVTAAFASLLKGLEDFSLRLGPELVRN
jgi:molybdopterin-biosynthesis enzyme MoeA-like protein